MVELIMVILMLGILAAVAMPRINTNEFRGVQFHDQVVQTLRYAQKTATSHRRLVCVAFTASTVTLTIAATGDAVSCSDKLNLADKSFQDFVGSNILTSPDINNIKFSPVPSDFYFKPDGTAPTVPPLTISGQTPIVVAGTTGYVQ